MLPRIFIRKLSNCIHAAALAFLLLSCGQEPGPVRSTSNLRMLDDTLINYNRGAARTEDQEIRDYTARYGWDMITTSTGLRYLIYKHGSGPAAKPGKIAIIRYRENLLNGKPVASSDSLGLKQFPVGHGEAEPGLQEAIQLMRTGDRAKVIIPSHLAFGLLGDGNRVPPGASLVYDIELVAVKDPSTAKPGKQRP
jgi:FKBP-type peptidyl-prolyl cis-trans isomerase FkpA